MERRGCQASGSQGSPSAGSLHADPSLVTVPSQPQAASPRPVTLLLYAEPVLAVLGSDDPNRTSGDRTDQTHISTSPTRKWTSLFPPAFKCKMPVPGKGHHRDVSHR